MSYDVIIGYKPGWLFWATVDFHKMKHDDTSGLCGAEGTMGVAVLGSRIQFHCICVHNILSQIVFRYGPQCWLVFYIFNFLHFCCCIFEAYTAWA